MEILYKKIGQGILQFAVQKHLMHYESLPPFIPYVTVLVSSLLTQERVISFFGSSCSLITGEPKKGHENPLRSRLISPLKWGMKPFFNCAHGVDFCYSRIIGVRTTRKLQTDKVILFRYTRGEIFRAAVIKAGAKTALPLICDLLIIRTLGALDFSSCRSLSLRSFYLIEKRLSMSLYIALNFLPEIPGAYSDFYLQAANREKMKLLRNTSELNKEELLSLILYFEKKGEPICDLFSSLYPAQWNNFIRNHISLTEAQIKEFIYIEAEIIKEEKENLLLKKSELSQVELAEFISYTEKIGDPVFDLNNPVLAGEWELLLEGNDLETMQNFLHKQLLSK